MKKQKSKIIVISFFDNLNKKDLLISILISLFDKSIVKITIIDTDAYYLACKFKKAQVFIIFMKNLEF